MTALSALWLPILVSAVVCFVVSSIIHMGPFWHRSDYPFYEGQDRVLDALRPLAIPPGDYMIPRAPTSKEMSSPEFVEKITRGPVVIMTVLPGGPFSMGKNLAQWFVYLVVVGFLAAYVTSRAVAPVDDPTNVLRFAGTTAFIAHSVAAWPVSIWYRRAWSLTLKSTVDGLVYGVVTGFIFMWMWPGA